MFGEFEFPKIEQLNLPSGRLYRTPEGNLYPSVTTVLSSVKGDGSLEKWREAVGEEKANHISQRATSRGTRIHKLVEDFLLGKEVIPRSILDKLNFDSLVPSLQDIQEVYAIEQGLYSDYLKSAGTVDIVGRYGGKRSIIDIKTSNRMKYKSEIDSYFIQTAAYSVFWEERTGQPVPQLVIMMSVDMDVSQVFVDRRDNWIDSYIEIRKNFEENRQDNK